ncbi:aldose epimerase family protein [Marinoscillum sp.]|uniref:aldose epimerase family protein n=1 Tax=Marinoscillum sp. TaxID=2024838 RepID=UPI003BADACB2
MKNSIAQLFFLTGLFFLVIGCSAPQKKEEKEAKATVSSAPFGTLPSGAEVTQYTMTNTNGMEAKVISYGGIITSLTMPDREGQMEDIVLGYDNLQGYLDASPYFGAIIGRYGNRIAKGKFTIDDVDYQLPINNIGNSLHGGITGFDKVNWTVKEVPSDKGVALKLTYQSVDMEEGYPGNLDVTVTYTLGDDNTLTFDYQSTTDKKTVVNLTQHSYFNLSAMKDDVLSTELMINADAYLPVDSTLIPTGEIRPVAGTPFDFTTSKKIGEEIGADNQQLAFGGGYDHCWVLNEDPKELSLAATAYDPSSGRAFDVYTSEPGIQFYSGNFLDGTITGKSNNVYKHRSGFCLETQHFPDSPNQESFPTTILSPGETYQTTTLMKFYTK